MATALPTTDSNPITEWNNGESQMFSLIWLDSNKDDLFLHLNVRKNLHFSVDSIETFEKSDECENYIRQSTDKCHHIVIIGEELGHDFIPRIHDLSQVFSIYIFEHSNQTQKCVPWIKEYSKVKNVLNQIDDLTKQIMVDRKRWHIIGDSLVFTIFNIYNNIERSSLNINGTFLHFQLLIELLLRLKSTEVNRTEFIDMCRKEFAGKQTILDTIDEFEQDYCDQFALWWYTRDTFLYRQLNKVLRLQNIDWLFHFRFFIHDMHELLKELQGKQRGSTSFDIVYRAQLLSSDELVQLKNSIDGLISFLSFLSTSRNRQHTLFLLGDDPTTFGSLHPILFEMQVENSVNDGAKPFADITGMSVFSNEEQEILFMIGSVFRLVSTYMEGCVTVFKMTLCSDNDHDLKTLFERMKSEIGIGTDDTVLTLGTLLWKSGRFDQAEQFYHRMLTEIQSDDQLVQNCYQGLGFIAAAKGDFDSGLIWHTKVLKHYQQTLPSDDYRIGCILNSIGNIYWQTKKYTLALGSYTEATKIFRQHHDRDLGTCLNNMGNVYEEMKQYKDALKYHQKAIDIRESILHPNHPELGTSHHNIANVYLQLGELNLARSHIKSALNIFQKSLRSNDPSIATTYQTMGALELNCGAYRQGLRYLEQAAALFRETLPSNHPTLENIHLTILGVIKAMAEYGLDFI